MKHRIWWAIAAAVLLMGIGILGSGAMLKAAASPVGGAYDLISATAGSSASGSPVKLMPDDISAIQGAMEGSRLSWWAASRGAIGTATRNTQADVFAVTGAFQDFHHIDMLYGSFLPRAQSGMAAVLESDLAYRLFGTEDAVGLEVTFMGKTFQVCGIYRTDGSLTGLMSGNGMFRAYVSGSDLVVTGKMTIGGFEAMLPHGAPGESLQSVESSMQAQGISTSSFLIEDRTGQSLLDNEKALIPLLLLAVSAMLVLLAFFLRIVRGVIRDSAAIWKESYFRNVWESLLWQLGELVLLLAASIGLCWLLWRGINLKFFLPAKYIPGSWIDLSFYTNLIKTESQASIAAQAYGRQWWDIAYAASVKLSALFGSLAVVGSVAAALSLRALWADRRFAAALEPGGKARGKWDAPVLWLLALLSFGVASLLGAWMGLPFTSGLGALLALALVLGIWVIAMHKGELERLFGTKSARS